MICEGISHWSELRSVRMATFRSVSVPNVHFILFCSFRTYYWNFVSLIALLSSLIGPALSGCSDGSNESSLIDINDIDKAPEKFITTGSGEPLPRYAVKCSPQDLLHNCFRTHSFFALLNCGIQLLKPAWNRYKHSERRRYEQGFIFV